MNRRAPAWVMASLFLLSAAAAFAADKPGGQAAELVVVTATVEKIDMATREVTLKGADGKLETIKVGPEARNLGQLKVGDKVTFKYYQALAISVEPAGDKPPIKETTDVQRAPLGEKPGGQVANVVEAVATVEALDLEKRTATIRGPKGNVHTLKVRDQVPLDKVKVGDKVIGALHRGVRDLRGKAVTPRTGGEDMIRGKTAGMLVLFALIVPLLAGCAPSLQAKKADVNNAFLVDPSVLQKGTGDQALYRYQNPKADFKKYSQVIIDPVLLYHDKALEGKDIENYQKLANNAYIYLVEEMKKDYRIATVPGPDTVRIQFAIVDAKKAAPVRNFLSTFMPPGIIISTAKYAATGKPAGVGEISGEFKMTDSDTGELLGAALDKRVGGKTMSGAFDTWEGADAGMQYWAKRIRYMMCEARGRQGLPGDQAVTAVAA